jgi:hypothetical protein
MPRIYGFVGWIGSGKDTAADYLTDKYQYARVSYAESLKDALAAIFGWDRVLLEGRSVESRLWRESVDTWWSRRLGIKNFTPRWALQHVGTDVMRDHFHPDVWIASTERKIQQYWDQGLTVVVSDCRFPNELASIKDLGGRVIQISRGNQNPLWYECALRQTHANEVELAHLNAHNMTMEKLWPQVHFSEWRWVGFPVDHLIYNNDTPESMHAQLDQMIFSDFLNSKIAD